MFILAFKLKAFHLFLPNLILFVTKDIKIKEKVKEESSHVLKIFLSITRARGFHLVWMIRFQIQNLSAIFLSELLI